MTAALLVLGMMDVRAMAVVTSAISLERLAPEGKTGAAFVAAGLILLARPFELG